MSSPAFAAMVLAAGLGTRLRPLSDHLPKPLLPVGDRPLLLSTVEKLLQAGAEKVLVNAHYHAREIVSACGNLGPKVQVICEEEILGTAGGVRGALPLLPELPLLVCNGDIYQEELPAELWSFLPSAPASSLERRLGVGLLASPPAPGTRGTLGLGSAGEVVRLRTWHGGTELSSLNYSGTLWLERPHRLRLPERGCLVGDFLMPELAAGRQVEVLESRASFVDIGSPQAYAEANLAWLAARGLSSWCAPRLRPGPEQKLEACVLGDGVVLEGSGELLRVIAWPGARVKLPLRDAVVTSSSQVFAWKERG